MAQAKEKKKDEKPEEKNEATGGLRGTTILGLQLAQSRQYVCLIGPHSRYYVHTWSLGVRGLWEPECLLIPLLLGVSNKEKQEGSGSTTHLGSRIGPP